MPEISIIVISYNRKGYLEKCLKSLEDQETIIDFEVIVIDQGSIDGAIETAEKYVERNERFRISVFRQKGLNAKRNKGLELAKASMIGFVDDDCIVDRSWVDSCYKAFKENDNIHIVTGRILPLNKGYKRSIRTSRKKRIWGRCWFDRVICWRSGCGNNLVLDEHVVNRIGNFDEDIGAGTASNSGGDDTEFIYRALVEGFKIKYVPEMIVYHPQPTSFKDYKARSEYYYKGIAAFVRKKYLCYPSAILMLLLRILHSFVLLTAAALAFRNKTMQVKLIEIRATIEGLVEK